MDGKLLARKETPEPAPLEAPFGPGSGPRTLSLIVKAEAGKPSGMGRTVCVREREESQPTATAPAAKAGAS